MAYPASGSELRAALGAAVPSAWEPQSVPLRTGHRAPVHFPAATAALIAFRTEDGPGRRPGLRASQTWLLYLCALCADDLAVQREVCADDLKGAVCLAKPS